MKAKYLFGRVSFIILCGLLVSFSFVREFAGSNEASFLSAKGAEVEEFVPANLVNVKILNCDDQVIYKTQVDLEDATRKKDAELISLLKTSEFVRKDEHTLFFRLLK